MKNTLNWFGMALSFSLGISAQAAPKNTADTFIFSIPLVQEIDSSCPPPTQLEDGRCVLNADTVLTKTLLLSSGTTLDCKGHKLTPSINGQSASWGWADGGKMPFLPSVPSTPTTAVLLVGETSNVTVKNCVVENFDFSVVIANSKLPNAAKTAKDDNPNCEKSNCEKSNCIINNTLNNRYRGVEIIASDGIEVSCNTIHSLTGVSGGVSIAHDSDDNLVRGNTYVGPSADPIPGELLPGGPGPLFPGGKDEWSWKWGGEAVRVLGPVFSYNFRVGDRMFVGTKNFDASAQRNLIEENDIEVPNPYTNALVADSGSDHTTFMGNDVRLGADGIRCVGHADGDDSTASRNVLVEGNTIVGAGGGVLAANTEKPVIRNNKITHAGGGIVLVYQRNATVMHNEVTDSAIGLFLFGIDSDWSFGAYISKNDIFGNDLAVEAYIDAPLELSVNEEGNYWGHSSEPGWLPSDTNDPDMVTDSYPYLVPVAGSSD